MNKKYKDTVFRKLFSNKSALLSLYNAINGTDYDNQEDLEITTIGDAIYMGFKNDVSFLIDNYMNLYEAQSTRNPNMPLRGLIYFRVATSQVDMLACTFGDCRESQMLRSLCGVFGSGRCMRGMRSSTG